MSIPYKVEYLLAYNFQTICVVLCDENFINCLNITLHFKKTFILIFRNCIDYHHFHLVVANCCVKILTFLRTNVNN